MDTNMKLFTVTNTKTNRLVSIPMSHVVTIYATASGGGAVSHARGGSFDTVETYNELVSKWARLTSS